MKHVFVKIVALVALLAVLAMTLTVVVLHSSAAHAAVSPQTTKHVTCGKIPDHNVDIRLDGGKIWKCYAGAGNNIVNFTNADKICTGNYVVRLSFYFKPGNGISKLFLKKNTCSEIAPLSSNLGLEVTVYNLTIATHA